MFEPASERRTGFSPSEPQVHPGAALKPRHFRRPKERPFTADQRGTTTILFGNLTPKHEELICAVFRGSGYNFQNLPAPGKASFQIGREYCSNGLCNPNYFTAGSLIEYLRKLRNRGLSPAEITDRYVYLTLADCGPCRLGTYQSEYRQALDNAGFPGFRVITFERSNFISGGSSEPGLKFSADIGFGCLNALTLGDLLYSSAYEMRPYERKPGETDRAMADCVLMLSEFLRFRPRFELLEVMPSWLSRRINARHPMTRTLNSLGKYRRHLYDSGFKEVLARCAERLDEVEVDRTVPKPVVKVIGEFYSHLAESYANYDMFRFLESEGAQVWVETITGQLLYSLHRAKLERKRRKGLYVPYPDPGFWRFKRRAANWWSSSAGPFLFAVLARMYRRHYSRLNRLMGGFGHDQVDQAELVRLSREFYDPLTRGGEGYLEIAKSLYYTKRHLSHMILSMKPFGCMPSTQSDGVMAAVTARYPDILFVSVETSGDGDVNAFSRVQMALADARRKAVEEFDRAVSMSGVRIDEIRDFVDSNPEFLRPSLEVPRRDGLVGTAANYVLHVGRILRRRRRGRREASW